MPAVVVGPGDILNAHGYDGYVEMDEYFDAIVLYAALIANWVGAEKVERGESDV